ncbi:MAG: hypothetical protein RIC14_08020 [Filomicrobium sp.]
MSWEMQNVAAALAKKEIQLFVGPRPGKKSRDCLAALKLTHCCTLLSKREQVQPVRRICEELSCEWLWLPIEGGRLEILRETDVVRHLETLLQSIEAEPNPRIYFHCSAGIHRTGFLFTSCCGYVD